MSLTAVRRLVLAGTMTIAAVLLVVGGLTLNSHGGRVPEKTAAAAAPNRVLGPPLPTATATAPDGSAVTCASGAEPAISLEQASFDPLLSGGVWMERGDYRIVLHGRVVNETTSTIRVSTIAWKVGTTPWAVRTDLPAELGPGKAHAFTVRATFHSTKRAKARVAGHLRWTWSDARLAPCGTKGLIEDD